MNMATIATGPSAASSKPRQPPLVALSGNLCSDKSPPPPSTPSRGRGRSVTADVRIPREVVEERLHTTPEAVAELNTRKNLVGSARPRASGSTPTSPTSSPRCSSPPGGTGAGRRGRERHHDRRGAGRRPLRLGLHRLPRSRHRRRRHETPTQSGPRYPRRQRRRRPAGSNADALARCIAVGSLAGELSLLSALASRHLSSAHAELGR